MHADRTGPAVAIESADACSHLERRAVLRFHLLREKTTFMVVSTSAGSLFCTKGL